MEVRVFVFAAPAGARYQTDRTLRSLRAAGITAGEIGALTPESLGSLLQIEEPLLLLRAGCWLRNTGTLQFPPSSATGKGLCAFGAVQPSRGNTPHSVLWQQWFARTGGDFSRTRDPLTDLPEIASVFLDAKAIARLTSTAPASLTARLHEIGADLRVVHYPPLDVGRDEKLRVIQLITSLHRGGAERLALDLATELPAQNVTVQLVTLGRPLREAFPAPPDTIDLSETVPNYTERIKALTQLAHRFGADLVHAHLINRTDSQAITAAGLPLVTTVHNTQQGWPTGLRELSASETTLLVGCAQAVETDLRSARLPIPIRTAWNGIDLSEFRLTPDRLAAGQDQRRRWGFGGNDFLLVAVANPRPQKRLQLLPAILAATRQRLQGEREARLILVGENQSNRPEVARCVAEIETAISRFGLEPHVRWTGSTGEVPSILAAADVLVSTSAHEGLSLAQLEALAMNRTVVTTAVGGAAEIAWNNPAVKLLPTDATADQFTDLLAPMARQQRSGEPTAPVLEDFSRRQMAIRYRWLYRRAIATAQRSSRGTGLWVIINNFSTGGAQSSARRLLLGLAQQGIPVRTAVLQEEESNPTPGRRALIADGIPVTCLPPAGSIDPAEAVERLLEAIDHDPPAALLLWNVIPSYKLLLADALLDLPVFDVSPGEMFFDSLERYFAKPRSGLPYRSVRDYGQRLAGVIVKYSAEAERAAALGAPVHVIPNGIAISQTSPQSQPARSPDQPLVFGTAARIHPQKRLEDLLEAFQLAHPQLPPYQLLIAGGVERDCDSYAARLRELAEGLPVQWLGDQADIAAFHRTLEVFVMISDPAGCPNASLEAMASGLPVIATDVGGASEQVQDGETGRLVPTRSAPALAGALIDLAGSSDRRQQMGAAGRDYVQNRFSLERMISEFRRVCLE